jgi:hypothetical protein
VPKQKPHWKDQWEWCATYGKARIVLDRILPFLIAKKAEAETVLAFSSGAAK